MVVYGVITHVKGKLEKPLYVSESMRLLVLFATTPSVRVIVLDVFGFVFS